MVFVHEDNDSIYHIITCFYCLIRYTTLVFDSLLSSFWSNV